MPPVSRMASSALALHRPLFPGSDLRRPSSSPNLDSTKTGRRPNCSSRTSFVLHGLACSPTSSYPVSTTTLAPFYVSTLSLFYVSTFSPFYVSTLSPASHRMHEHHLYQLPRQQKTSKSDLRRKKLTVCLMVSLSVRRLVCTTACRPVCLMAINFCNWYNSRVV